MADENTVVEPTEAELDAEFDAGFEDDAAPVVKTGEESAEKKAEESVQAADTTVVEPPAKREVTEAEWQTLVAKAGEVDVLKAAHRSELDKVHGHVGKLRQDIDALRKTGAAPKAIAIEITEDIVSDLQKEFPEITPAVSKAFKKFGEKLQSALTVAAGQPTDGALAKVAALTQEEIAALVKAGQDETRQQVTAEQDQKNARQMLTFQHRDWQEVVGDTTKAGFDPSKNEYRIWLGKQPKAYQESLNATWDALAVGDSITKFKEEKAAAAKNGKTLTQSGPSPRKQRLAAAVVQRGAGGTAQSSSKTEDDEFNDGFKEG